MSWMMCQLLPLATASGLTMDSVCSIAIWVSFVFCVLLRCVLRRVLRECLASAADAWASAAISLPESGANHATRRAALGSPLAGASSRAALVAPVLGSAYGVDFCEVLGEALG